MSRIILGYQNQHHGPAPTQSNIGPMVSVHFTPKTYDTLLLPPLGFTRATDNGFLWVLNYEHTTRSTTILSRNEFTKFSCSSDAKLIYRDEQQPFWNVRGVQSQHGTFVIYGCSWLLALLVSKSIVGKLHTDAILTLLITVIHSLF